MYPCRIANTVCSTMADIPNKKDKTLSLHVKVTTGLFKDFFKGPDTILVPGTSKTRRKDRPGAMGCVHHGVTAYGGCTLQKVLVAFEAGNRIEASLLFSFESVMEDDDQTLPWPDMPSRVMTWEDIEGVLERITDTR